MDICKHILLQCDIIFDNENRESKSMAVKLVLSKWQIMKYKHFQYSICFNIVQMLPKQHEFLKTPNNLSHNQLQALSKPKFSKEYFYLFCQKRTKEIPTNVSVFSASASIWYQNLDLCQWGKAKVKVQGFFWPNANTTMKKVISEL